MAELLVRHFHGSTTLRLEDTHLDYFVHIRIGLEGAVWALTAFSNCFNYFDSLWPCGNDEIPAVNTAQSKAPGRLVRLACMTCLTGGSEGLDGRLFFFLSLPAFLLSVSTQLLAPLFGDHTRVSE